MFVVKNFGGWFIGEGESSLLGRGGEGADLSYCEILMKLLTYINIQDECS